MKRGFAGLCGLFLFLLTTALGGAQTIQFLPGAPSTYEAGGVAGTNISVIVTRTPGSGAASVQYSTFDGSALSGADYIGTNDVLNFADGETFKLINVPIIDDLLTEPSETFGVLLFSPVGANLGSNAVTLVTIFDNDTFFRFASTNLQVNEDVTNAVLTVLRVGDTNGSASVDFSTVDGTAIFNADYLATSGTILFTNGQLSATISIPIVDDCTVETNLDFFQVVLSNPIGGSVAPNFGVASVVIRDNDNGVGRIRITGATVDNNSIDFYADPMQPLVREGNTTTLTVHVFRECGSSGRIDVDITNFINSATCPGELESRHGLDFVLNQRTLTWLDGQGNGSQGSEQTFTITITDDILVELDETNLFSLINIRGGTAGNPPSFGGARQIPVVIRSDDMSAGSVDWYYNPIITPGANNEVYAVSVVANSAIGNNGKTLLAGEFTGVNAIVRNRIARVHVDGSVDASFDPGSGADGFIDVLVEQSDGKIVIGGGFTSFNNISRRGVARLNEDGSLDPGFIPGSGVRGIVRDIALQADGKMIIVGEFTAYNDVPVNNIARLLPNGTLDTTFNPGTGPDAPIWAVAMERSTAIINVGAGNSGAGPAEFRTNITVGGASGIVTVTYDFACVPDTLHIYYGATLIYNSGMTNNYLGDPLCDFALYQGPITVSVPFGGGGATVVSIVINEGSGDPGTVWQFTASVDANGEGQRFYVGGEFTSFNGQPRSRIARLLGDGDLDTAFAPAFGADNTVYSLAVQGNLAILVGGSFQTFDGLDRAGLVRLLTNGTVDTTFSSGSGVLGAVFDIKLQPDQMPIIGGDFTLYNGTARTNIARLYTDGTLDTSFGDNHYLQAQSGPNGFVNSISIQTNGNIMAGGAFSLIGGGQDGIFGLLTNAVRPQFNFTRFIGGTNPGALNMPGNIEFVSAQYSVDENSLSGSVLLTVRRLHGEVGPITTSFYTVDGSGHAGTDFSGTSGTVIFGDCDTLTRIIQIPIFDNSFVEGNRTFTVILTNPVNGSLPSTQPALGAQTRATVTILDNDFNRGVLGFQQPVFNVDETGNATVTVVRTNGSVGQVTVQYATYALTATGGIDYTTTSGTLTFASGDTNKSFFVPIASDVSLESEEWFGVRLTNATGGAVLGLSNATVLIYDNDFGRGSVSFTNSELAVSESAGFATIPIRRTSGGLGYLTNDFIAYELPLGPGVARADIDFTPVTNRVVFPPGVLTQYVTVPIISDRFVEGNERIGLLLTNVSNGTLGFLRQSTLTIVDDDSYGSLGFSDVNYFISERGTNALITLTRVGGDAEDVSVDFATVAISATDGEDYVGTNMTVTFPDGVRTVVVALPILDDELLEENETVSLVLNNFQKATPGTFTNSLLTIIDNEALNAPAGSVDTTFDAHPNSFINALGLQSSGKLIVGGDFTSINSFGFNRIARLNVTGSTDPLFKVGQGANGQVQAILIQPDDKIIVGGRFTTYDVTNRARIARLNADGTIDSSFNPGAGADNPVFALALTPDQRVVLGGSFTTVNGVTRPNVAVLNTNGSVDFSFSTGAGLNGTVYAVAVQPDGKILIGGDFTMVNNTNRSRIARLHPNGSLDVTFNPPGGAAGGAVRAILLQPDGNIVVGGSFTNFNGAARNHLARLLPSGGLDPSFDAGSGADAAVLALALQGNGRILVAGDFHVFNGVSRNRLTRLAPDGSIDPSINFGTGANSFIAAVLLQPNEQIVIGGGFTEFNGVPRQYVARLIGGVNDGAGTFNFISGVFTVNENGTNAVITVSRDGGTAGIGTVNFSTFDGSGFAPGDYQATNGTLTFPPGETLQTFSVRVVNDHTVDGDVVVFLALDSPSAGAELGLTSDAVLVIRDDDCIIRFVTENYSVNEGVAAGHAIIAVERVGSTNTTVAVNFATVGGTATSPDDYTASSGLVVFSPGETLREFTVPVFEDTNVEAPETVLLQLSSPIVFSGGGSDAFLGLSDATLTIVDNDFLPGQFTFSAQTNVVGEADGFITITVLRTNGSSGIVSVRYSLGGGTAAAGVDYLAASGLLSFADGETAKSFSVVIINDQSVEGDETVLMTLSNPTGGASLLSTNPGTLLIIDDESGVQFESATYSAAEDDGSVRVTVIRSGNTNVVASVGFFTAPQTASAPADYIPTNGTLTFLAGVVRQLFDILIVSDTVTELPETFRVLLNNPSSNVQIGAPSNAVITIQDSARFVHFSATDYIVNEGDTNAVITIERSGLLTRGISVIFRTRDGSAVAGADYLYTSNIVKFAAGESNKTVLVPIFDDGLTEGPETVLLDLVFPTNAAVILPGTATLTIADNDAGPGGPDSTFDPGAGANKFVRAVALQQNGRILVGGAFTNFANVTNRNFLARLNTNGVFDTNFIVAGPNALVSAVAADTNGHIVIGGAFTNVNSNAFNRMARLLDSGASDPTLSQSLKFDAAVNALELLSDGRIVAGGGFSLPTRGVARLRVNGSTDLTFDVGSGTDAPVLAAKLQPDGMVLIGGGFTNVSGFPYPRLVRIAANGLIDTSLQPLTITNGNVLSIAVQADGKILIGGTFRFVNGFARGGIARLNSDGSLDLTFDPGTGPNGSVYTVNVLANGHVFIGGDFTSVNGFTRNRYALLQTGGAVDEEFDSSLGADNTVYSSVVQPDQKIIIGGDFVTVGGLTRRGVARINVGETLLRASAPVLSINSATVTVNSQPGRTYALEGSTNMVQWFSLSTNTATGLTLDLTDSPISGVPYRFYRVRRLVP